MVKVFATLNNKDKRREEINCETFDDFKGEITRIFNIDPATIKIMRPPTRVNII